MINNKIPSIIESTRWGDSIAVALDVSYERDWLSVGEKPRLAVETNDSDTPMSWMSRSAVRKIAVAVWPSTQLRVVFDDPQRHWQTHVRGRMTFRLNVVVTGPLFVCVEAIHTTGSDAPEYVLLVPASDNAKFEFSRLEPDYQGLTRTEVDDLAKRLGLPPKEFLCYSQDGIPEDIGGVTLLSLPE